MFFFFIGGIQPRTVTVDRQPRVCPVCGQRRAYIRRTDHYLSLFFIPLLRVKKGEPFLYCENCSGPVDSGREPGIGQDICPACGRRLKSDYRFCPYCGTARRKHAGGGE